MGKKKYIKPDIREESQILTVSAWVTQTQYVIAVMPTTTTSVSTLDTYVAAIEAVSETSYAQITQLTESNVAQQTVFTRVNYAVADMYARAAARE